MQVGTSVGQYLSGYEVFISWRYLRSKRKEVFISLISLISIAGVAVGVMALIIVLAVMTGLSGELRDKILGTNAHIVIFKRGGWIEEYRELHDQIAHVEHVKGVGPFILRQVMIQANSFSTESTVKGIAIDAVQQTSDLAASIVQGRLDFLEMSHEGSLQPGHGLLIGAELAKKLHVTIGETVLLISPMRDETSSWPAPKRQMFEVTGIFEYGMYEYDSNLVYISFLAAQEYFQTGDLATGIEIKTDHIFRSRQIASDLQQTLGYTYSVRDWSEMNKSLLAIFGLYKKAMFLMLTLIVIVACLNIASTLILMVMEKNHDIAILKSMGASSASIMRLFVMQGLFIGVVGTALGCGLGSLICWVADTYHLIRLEGGVYYLNYLPFRMMPLDLTLVAVSSILICFLATLYPARQAARLDPAVALRCE
ncbi:MAG: lipoprotein-releasing ABC transporter permease subunit [Candidatus Vecturithrix sp.]|nr:lipoprotein-releasing ABC transporter permease subunit [Candidatus Vecturithrix sp.]